MSVRPFVSGDREQLIALWQTVFGDDARFVGDFLDRIVSPGRGMVWDEAGQLTAAAYIIDGIRLAGRDCPYIYAVSTLPAFRGRGYGAAVSNACAALIESQGGIAALHPAEESLFGWYAQQGFQPLCTVREAVLTPNETAPAALTPLSPAEYAARRRELLRDAPAADFEPRLLDWWSGWSGGAFYGYDGGCLCICTSGSRSFVPELLAKQDACAALAAAAGGSEVLVRTPALPGFQGFGPELPFISGRGSGPFRGYWGFAFE